MNQGPLGLLSWVAQIFTEVPLRMSEHRADELIRELCVEHFTDLEREALFAHYGGEEAIHQAWRDELRLLQAVNLPTDTDFHPEIAETDRGPRIVSVMAGPVDTKWMLGRAAEHLEASRKLIEHARANGDPDGWWV